MFLLKLCVTLITCVNIKQNLGHVWFLGPHTLGKLILLIISLSVKQNLDNVGFIGPHALGNLTIIIIRTYC